MKKIINILIVLFFFTISSCDKWLEVTPKGQVEANDLLKTSDGYRSALSGIYYKLIQKDLFGEDLAYGFIDAISQYWDISYNSHLLMPVSKFDYKHNYSISKINNFWKKFYEAIAQCNQIIEALEDSSPNDIKDYNIIKGEVYGLRAFIHLQLYTLFAPMTLSKTDLTQRAIEYRTKYNVVAGKFNTCAEFLVKIKEDLKTSKELLADDPIKVNGRTGNGNISALDYRDVLDRRGSRFNYYATLGLLAKVELLSFEKTEALKYIKQFFTEVEANIINTNSIFHLVTKDEIAGDVESFRDIKFSSEMIFSLYIKDLDVYAGQIFAYKDYDISTKTYLKVDYENLKDFLYGSAPDGSGDDYRLNYWFGLTEGYSRNWYRLTSYKKAIDFGGSSLAHYPEIPMLDIAEMYYMACEASLGSNNEEALKYLNKVRESRGLQALTGITDELTLTNLLVKEQRKNYIGRGKMFSIYKRLNKKIDVEPGVSVEPSKSIYVFPIPENEYEFSPNDKPE